MKAQTCCNISDLSEQGKRCTKCKELKDYSQFYTKGKSSNGQGRIDSVCKECKKEQIRKKRAPKTRVNNSRKINISTNRISEIPDMDFIISDFQEFLRNFAFEAAYSIEEDSDE
jgi:hypothetical protein